MKTKAIKLIVISILLCGFVATASAQSNAGKAKKQPRTQTLTGDPVLDSDMSFYYPDGRKKQFSLRYSPIVIKRGDEAIIKIIFDNTLIKSLMIDDIGEMPKEQWKKEEWIVRVKPEKTTGYRIRTEYHSRDGFTDYFSVARIIVVDPSEWDQVKKKLDELDVDGKENEYGRYLDKLAGGSVADFMDGKVK